LEFRVVGPRTGAASSTVRADGARRQADLPQSKNAQSEL
jgi:hypothetical protein